MTWVERRLGLTASGAAVLGIAAVGWLGARWSGSRVLYLVCYAMAGLVVSAWLAGARRPDAEVTRSDVPVRVREAQTVSVELTLRAKRRLATLVVTEQLPPEFGPPARLPVPLLLPGREVRHRYSFTPGLRGVYDIGPLVAVRRDPFGLTARRIPLLDTEQLIVHPHTERVLDRVLAREWEDPPVRPPQSKPWPTGFEFYGMRDYTPGDDPRRIVWRAVARTGRYLVREAEQGITDRVTILVDNDAARHSPGTRSDTFETAVRAAASVGTHHLQEGYAVTLDTASGRVLEGMRGQRMRVRYLDEIARLTLGRGPLSDGLRRLVGDARRNTHYVIVASELASGSAALIRVLLDRGGSVLFVHVVAPDAEPEAARGAAVLGCEVVELTPGTSLQAAFRRGIGAGVR